MAFGPIYGVNSLPKVIYLVDSKQTVCETSDAEHGIVFCNDIFGCNDVQVSNSLMSLVRGENSARDKNFASANVSRVFIQIPERQNAFAI